MDVVMIQREASSEAVTSNKAPGGGARAPRGLLLSSSLGGQRGWRAGQLLRRRRRSSVTARLKARGRSGSGCLRCRQGEARRASRQGTRSARNYGATGCRVRVGGGSVTGYRLWTISAVRVVACRGVSWCRGVVVSWLWAIADRQRRDTIPCLPR